MKTPHTQASFFPDFKPSRYKTYKAKQRQGGGPVRPGARDTQPPPSWLQRKMFTYNDYPHPTQVLSVAHSDVENIQEDFQRRHSITWASQKKEYHMGIPTR